MKYEVDCKYTEGYFVRGGVVPRNDNYRLFRRVFDCEDESRLHEITREYLRDKYGISEPKIVGMIITRKSVVYEGQQLTLC